MRGRPPDGGVPRGTGTSRCRAGDGSPRRSPSPKGRSSSGALRARSGSQAGRPARRRRRRRPSTRWPRPRGTGRSKGGDREPSPVCRCAGAPRAEAASSTCSRARGTATAGSHRRSAGRPGTATRGGTLLHRLLGIGGVAHDQVGGAVGAPVPLDQQRLQRRSVPSSPTPLLTLRRAHLVRKKCCARIRGSRASGRVVKAIVVDDEPVVLAGICRRRRRRRPSTTSTAASSSSCAGWPCCSWDHPKSRSTWVADRFVLLTRSGRGR